ALAVEQSDLAAVRIGKHTNAVPFQLGDPVRSVRKLVRTDRLKGNDRLEDVGHQDTVVFSFGFVLLALARVDGFLPALPASADFTASRLACSAVIRSTTFVRGCCGATLISSPAILCCM